MAIPEQYTAYECADYFASERFTHGYFDETSQMTIIYAAADLAEHSELGFLAVGRPGVDGMEWGYRRGESGLWAYYPIGREFMYLAPTVAALVDGWYSGAIVV
jgi:hypothetical protein